MKFSEKLQTLRKEKHITQEQLADMLSVSRQSVSKWESHQTYPEMDKLIELAKIFGCTLDELTNDEIKEISVKENNKKYFSNLVNNFLVLIKRSYDMLKKMSFINIVGCILEMFVVFLVLLLLHNVVDYIYYLGQNIFIDLKYVGQTICNIWNFILEITYLLFSIMVFIYIYKIRYLDRYGDIDVIINKQDVVSNQKKVEKVIIKHEVSNGFFDILAKIVLFCIKIFVVIFIIPFISTLIFLGLCLIINVIMLFSKVFYFGPLFIILSLIVLNTIVLYFAYYFIFDKRINVKKSFIIILASFLVFGFGCGVCFIEFANTNFTDDISLVADKKQMEKSFKMTDDMLVYSDYGCIYEIDNNLTNEVKIVVNYYDKYYNFEVVNNNNNIYVRRNNLTLPLRDIYKLIINDLQEKNIHNYFSLDAIEVKVISSRKNIETIKNNYYQDELYNFQKRIDELQETIYEKDEEINELSDMIYGKNIEIEELKEKIDFYKEQINKLNNY